MKKKEEAAAPFKPPETTTEDRLNDRCRICSYTIDAHREQDPAKRRFGMCDRGLGKPL